MIKKYNFKCAQDWHIYFKLIFEKVKINNFLEFGLGNGTEFLLDHCGHVTSIEISLGSYNKSWYDTCKSKYKNYTNWNPVYIEASQEIIKANEIAQQQRYPISYTDHLPELKKIIDRALQEKGYDFIFVDAGIHNRGDIINLIMGKAPIIAAHDSSRVPGIILKDVYGYNIVQPNSEYLEFHFEDSISMGTTIWVNKNFNENVIKVLKERLK